MNETHLSDFFQSVGAKIYLYESILVVPAGLLFNILTVIVFSSSKFKQTNFGFISILVTLSQTLSLTATCVVYKYLSYINMDPSYYFDSICFFFAYLMRFIQMIPSFLEVFLSVYQYMEITYIRDHIFKKKRNILFTICCELTLVALVNIPNLFRRRLEYQQYHPLLANETISQISCGQTGDLLTMANIVTFLLRALIPMPLIVIFSFLIARTLFRSRKCLDGHQHQTRQRNDTNRLLTRELSFAFSLFANNFIYFLLNFPVSISYVMENFVEISEYNFIFLLHDIMNSVAILYSSLPFFINFTFNRTFRSQTCRIFTKLTKCLR
jgi:hypothetical protein